ncbi:hypothetical protein ISN45_At04g034410 [Arabidopsis thaliana x Arabidopsis arenosa]|uniref:Uncharacterized protein n=2 Tax=Arabidopsis TaxID=3701 RepID=A0A8T2EGT8_ARASU|nr:hypothetical protein ISN45_At04g034410 [Arabidopsis thaliana x Arabidopsis arenosa]KAG7622609.1 hypothetical protein ISN44_As04g033920 [Arabidopsis suecica]
MQGPSSNCGCMVYVSWACITNEADPPFPPHNALHAF